MDEFDLSIEDKCRISAASAEGAGEFQTISAPERALPDKTYLINFYHRYGLPQKALDRFSRCTTKCPTHNPNTTFDAATVATFRMGAHAFSCPCLGSLEGHDAVLSEVEQWFSRTHSISATRDANQCHLTDGKRLDSVVKDWATSRFSGLGLDITIVCATAPSYTTDAHAADSTKLLRDAAAAKHAKHAADCHAQQYEYATAAWSTLGGMGGEFLHKYFNPYYQQARAKAKAAGESVHAVSQERQMWCERFAAAIAVRNRRMLDRTRDANSIAA